MESYINSFLCSRCQIQSENGWLLPQQSKHYCTIGHTFLDRLMLQLERFRSRKKSSMTFLPQQSVYPTLSGIIKASQQRKGFRLSSSQISLFCNQSFFSSRTLTILFWRSVKSSGNRLQQGLWSFPDQQLSISHLALGFYLITLWLLGAILYIYIGYLCSSCFIIIIIII